MRLRLSGHTASQGSAVGRARLRWEETWEADPKHIAPDEVEHEIVQLHTAVQAAREEIHQLRQRLQHNLAGEVEEFLDLHVLLLDDPELLYGVDDLIRSRCFSAGYALQMQHDRLAAVFDSMEDNYLKTRRDDLDYVIHRIYAHLHQRFSPLQGQAGEILVSDNVAPSELAELQSQGIVAIITTAGSPLSHSAILAQSLHLPMIVGVSQALHHIAEGSVVMVDATQGHVVIEPNADDLEHYRRQQQEVAREQRQLGRLRNKPSRTLDQVDIELFANAESLQDIAEAHQLGAAGLGLYRTEFLFLQRNELPDEEEQFVAYRDAVLAMKDRPVTIRALDLGADKVDRSGLSLSHEENPALGLRGIRLLFASPDIFDTQLRAIARASAYGSVRLLLPMISQREEVLAARRRLKHVIKQLQLENHPTAASIPLGAMIEVPAAAIGLESFIDAVDFLAIGTNDLLQYLLATDRNHDALHELYSPLHPAVLRILRHIVEVAGRFNIPLSICGEIAGNPQLTPLLLGLGLHHLSMHPRHLLAVRRRVRELSLTHLQSHQPALFKANSRAGIERWLKKVMADTP